MIPLPNLFLIGASVTITVNLGTGANLLSDFLWDILDNDSRYVVANFSWDLNANLFRYFFLYIHRVLCAHCFGEFFAFFPWNIDREVLASLIRNLFAFCARNWFFNLFRNLFAVLLRDLLIKDIDLKVVSLKYSWLKFSLGWEKFRIFNHIWGHISSSYFHARLNLVVWTWFAIFICKMPIKGV